MDLPVVEVLAVPPTSRVQRDFSSRVVSMALRMAAAASDSPRWSSIIAADQIWPMGLAMPWPAMSGAEPWTGSNSDGNRRSG